MDNPQPSTDVQVVGGAEHGGIIVRSGCELTSEMAESRLSTGSVVKDGSEVVMRCWDVNSQVVDMATFLNVKHG